MNKKRKLIDPQTPANPKRGRGRPKGSKNKNRIPSTITTTTLVKRGKGRPKGSKNKTPAKTKTVSFADKLNELKDAGWKELHDEPIPEVCSHVPYHSYGPCCIAPESTELDVFRKLFFGKDGSMLRYITDHTNALISKKNFRIAVFNSQVERVKRKIRIPQVSDLVCINPPQ